MKTLNKLVILLFSSILFFQHNVHANPINEDEIKEQMRDYAANLISKNQTENQYLVKLHHRLQPNHSACFSRTYDSNYLSKHKNQTIKKIFTKLKNQDDDYTSKGKGFLIEIKMESNSNTQSALPIIYGHCKLNGICGTGESRGENYIEISSLKTNNMMILDLTQIQIFSQLREAPYENQSLSTGDTVFHLFPTKCNN